MGAKRAIWLGGMKPQSMALLLPTLPKCQPPSALPKYCKGVYISRQMVKNGAGPSKTLEGGRREDWMYGECC
jgi:hypothetical protein